MTPTPSTHNDVSLSLRQPDGASAATMGPPSKARPPHDARRSTVTRRVVEAVVVLVLFGLAWLADEPVFRFLEDRRPYARIIREDFAGPFRVFGQYFTVVLVAAAIAVMDPTRRGQVIALLVTVAMASAWVPPVKLLAGRVRPSQAQGDAIFLGPEGALQTHRNHSFPSGHTAIAFAFASTLSLMYPRGRRAFLALAVGSGLTRVLDVQHFPSDVVAGAAPTLWLTSWIYRAGWLRRWADRWDRRLAPATGDERPAPSAAHRCARSDSQTRQPPSQRRGDTAVGA